MSFPDVSGVLTCGDSCTEALVRAEDALVGALGTHFSLRGAIPFPSPVQDGQELVALRPVAAARVALYLREKGSRRKRLWQTHRLDSVAAAVATQRRRKENDMQTISTRPTMDTAELCTKIQEELAKVRPLQAAIQDQIVATKATENTDVSIVYRELAQIAVDLHADIAGLLRSLRSGPARIDTPVFDRHLHRSHEVRVRATALLGLPPIR